jgi:hypothetical protein
MRERIAEVVETGHGPYGQLITARDRRPEAVAPSSLKCLGDLLHPEVTVARTQRAHLLALARIASLAPPRSSIRSRSLPRPWPSSSAHYAPPACIAVMPASSFRADANRDGAEQRKCRLLLAAANPRGGETSEVRAHPVSDSAARSNAASGIGPKPNTPDVGVVRQVPSARLAIAPIPARRSWFPFHSSPRRSSFSRGRTGHRASASPPWRH